MSTDTSNFMIEIYEYRSGKTIETVYDPSIKDKDAAIMAGIELCVHNYKNDPNIFYRIIDR